MEDYRYEHNGLTWSVASCDLDNPMFVALTQSRLVQVTPPHCSSDLVNWTVKDYGRCSVTSYYGSQAEQLVTLEELVSIAPPPLHEIIQKHTARYIKTLQLSSFAIRILEPEKANFIKDIHLDNMEKYIDVFPDHVAEQNFRRV